VVAFDSERTTDFIKNKPENFQIKMDIKLPDPCTINFSNRDSPNTLSLKPDLIIAVPLDFKIYPDALDSPGTATINLPADDLGGNDLFDRTNAADPLINIAGINPEDITITVSYINTLGITMDIAFISTVSGVENFRRVIPISGNANGFTLNLKKQEIPYPFNAGFKLILPADQYDPVKGSDYAPFKILPSGTMKITSLRANATVNIATGL
jgi:hypothetical protein